MKNIKKIFFGLTGIFVITSINAADIQIIKSLEHKEIISKKSELFDLNTNVESQDATTNSNVINKLVAYAQYKIGTLYYKGILVEENYQKAAGWYEEAAKNGNATAQFITGLMYHQGVGQTFRSELKDKDKKETDSIQFALNQLEPLFVNCNSDGFHDYRKEGEKWELNSPKISYLRNDVGFVFCNGEDERKHYQQAGMWHKKSVDFAVSENTSIWSSIQERDFNVSRDYKKAVKWYKKAANQGVARAQNNLGVMYSHGDGVDRDFMESARWIKKSAESGLSLAQFNIGNMYSLGFGVKQNNEEATMWYEKAASQGLAEAKYKLGHRYLYMSSKKSDYVKAMELFEQAANQGLSEAKIYLSQMQK